MYPIIKALSQYKYVKKLDNRAMGALRSDGAQVKVIFPSLIKAVAEARQGSSQL